MARSSPGESRRERSRFAFELGIRIAYTGQVAHARHRSERLERGIRARAVAPAEHGRVRIGERAEDDGIRWTCLLTRGLYFVRAQCAAIGRGIDLRLTNALHAECAL